MAYSMITLRAALEGLGYRKGGTTPFLWSEDPQVRVHPGLSDQFHGGRRRPNFLNDLTEYCWLVYRKAQGATGRQLIGRTGDLWVSGWLDKAGIDPGKKHTLWDPWTKGNIQVMDKWAPVVNDCWVLGGVHRRADFELVSKEAPANLWDDRAGYHIVTARELLGLRRFGYERREQKGAVVFRCADPALADGATLEAYDELMAEMAAKGPDSVTGLIHEMAPGLTEEIRSFDRAKLKPVKSP